VYNKIDKRDLKIGRYVHVYDLILFNDLNVMKRWITITTTSTTHAYKFKLQFGVYFIL